MAYANPNYHKDYYQKNRERILAQQKLYNEENKEKIQEYHVDWYLKNKDRVDAQQAAFARTPRGLTMNVIRTRKRQAQVLNQQCDCCTKEEFEAMYTAARKAGMEVDHVYPLSKGGLHCVQNMQLLTMTENRRKHAKVA